MLFLDRLMSRRLPVVTRGRREVPLHCGHCARDITVRIPYGSYLVLQGGALCVMKDHPTQTNPLLGYVFCSYCGCTTGVTRRRKNG